MPKKMNMDKDLRESPQRPRVSRIHLAISAAITLALFVYLYNEDTGGNFWEMAAGIDWSMVGLYFLLSLAGVLVRALRYQILLADILPSGQVPGTWRLILITFIRNTLVDLFPARLGELGYIYFLNRSGVPVASGASSFGFCVVLDIFVLVFIIGIFLALSLAVPGMGIGNIEASSTAAALGIVAVIFLVLFFAIQYVPRLFHFGATLVKRIAARLPGGTSARLAAWLEENIDHMGNDLERLAKRGILVRLSWYTFLLRVLKYASLYVLLLAVVKQWNLGPAEIHPIVSMLAFVIAEASASLPISGLMGFGMYESSWALVLAIANVEIPSLVKVGFLVHLITQVKAYSIGIAAMLVLMLEDLTRGENATVEERENR